MMAYSQQAGALEPHHNKPHGGPLEGQVSVPSGRRFLPKKKDWLQMEVS
jgi:hypothetical protein